MALKQLCSLLQKLDFFHIGDNSDSQVMFVDQHQIHNVDKTSESVTLIELLKPLDVDVQLKLHVK